MRLKTIKLAGFKSFVDPTQIHFPSNRVGIVGPNGCGKSNTIDAVRWVMGESSARHLRGQNLEDVIFSGAATRQPVGQASVELVFDNSEGRCGGEYARFNEISVKRVATREGQSRYFLNNTRCRRRDIADIFLGTGLGPRSYAIIEQGMISRLVEARPEDIRVYVEEAAGISKYKARRRETENRIRHTRENLERLEDIRGELAERLQRLEQQARTAERYRELKRELATLRARLLATRWRDIEAERESRIAGIRETAREHERHLTEQRRLEAELEAGREALEARNEAVDRAQAAFYQAGAEVSRLEARIEHRRELDRRQAADRDEARAALEETREALEAERERSEELAETLEEREEAREIAAETLETAEASLEQAEAGMEAWSADWEAFREAQAEPVRVQEVERRQVSTLAAQVERHRQQLAELEDVVEDGPAAGELADLEAALEEAGERRAELEAERESRQARLAEARQRLETARREREARAEAVQQDRARLASLNTLQEAALAPEDEALADWLAEAGIDGNRRLAQVLTVEDGWERAVELVLGHWLDAPLVDALAPEPSPAAGLALIRRGEAEAAGAGMLAARVRAPARLAQWLAGVQAVADAETAWARRETLGPGESVITPDGLWLGPDWLRTAEAGDSDAGVLARERAITELESRIESGEAALAAAEAEVDAAAEAVEAAEAGERAAQARVNRAHGEESTARSELHAARVEAEQARLREEERRRRAAELAERIAEDEAALEESRERVEAAEERLETLAEEREALEQRRERLRITLEETRGRVREVRGRSHDLTVAVEGLRRDRQAAVEGLRRLEAQRARQAERLERLAAAESADDTPVAELEAELEALLEGRLAAEKTLEAARREQAETETAQRERESSRSAEEQAVAALRDEIEAAKLAEQELRVRAQTVREQLVEEAEAEPAEVLAGMDIDASAEALGAEVERLEGRIRRLGNINLAAIDEFREQSERKTYLDEQHADLEQALATLESAIARIDRETRSRFRETFERINTNLREIFPKLFGGGEGFLEMTGEDLLDTGVAIMARPPGKRITHIHLMSGGEKALTAVAMVFSIFRLNPAPFCLLDEVDAPLDDANVGRFSEMVREMSEQVQFIFITHNKVTMELSSHLTGVTMREPGVSRVVAVDVEEAVRIAGS